MDRPVVWATARVSVRCPRFVLLFFFPVFFVIVPRPIRVLDLLSLASMSDLVHVARGSGFVTGRPGIGFVVVIPSTSFGACGPRIPCLAWFESTYVLHASFYRRCVLNRRHAHTRPSGQAFGTVARTSRWLKGCLPEYCYTNGARGSQYGHRAHTCTVVSTRVRISHRDSQEHRRRNKEVGNRTPRPLEHLFEDPSVRCLRNDICTPRRRSSIIAYGI